MVSDAILVHAFLGVYLRERIARESQDACHQAALLDPAIAEARPEWLWGALEAAGYRVQHLRRVARVMAGVEV